MIESNGGQSSSAASSMCFSCFPLTCVGFSSTAITFPGGMVSAANRPSPCISLFLTFTFAILYSCPPPRAGRFICRFCRLPVRRLYTLEERSVSRKMYNSHNSNAQVPPKSWAVRTVRQSSYSSERRRALRASMPGIVTGGSMGMSMAVVCYINNSCS